MINIRINARSQRGDIEREKLIKDGKRMEIDEIVK